PTALHFPYPQSREPSFQAQPQLVPAVMNGHAQHDFEKGTDHASPQNPQTLVPPPAMPLLAVTAFRQNAIRSAKTDAQVSASNARFPEKQTTCDGWSGKCTSPCR